MYQWYCTPKPIALFKIVILDHSIFHTQNNASKVRDYQKLNETLD